MELRLDFPMVFLDLSIGSKGGVRMSTLRFKGITVLVGVPGARVGVCVLGAMGSVNC